MRENIAPGYAAATAAVRNLDTQFWNEPDANRSFVMVGVPETDILVHGLKSAGVKSIQHVAAIESSARVFQNSTTNAGTVFCVRFDDNRDSNSALLRTCRSQNHGSVVLAVLPPSANADTAHAALEAGADDFIFNSSSVREIMIRCAARSNTVDKPQESVIIGDLTVDVVGRLVKAPQGTKFLSPIDFRIVYVLAAAGGNVVTRDKIKAECWQTEKVSDNAVNRKIHEVRRIIMAISKQVGIRTVYGLGFALVNEGT